MSEIEAEGAPSGIHRSARPTPVDEDGRAELAAMAAGLSLDSITQVDSRLLTGVLHAAQSALAAPFATLQFLGTDQVWYGGSEQCSAQVQAFAEGVTRSVVHADDVIEVPTLCKHPSYANTAAVTGEPALRWMVTVPVRGYNSLIVGALTLFDVVERDPISAAERATLDNLISVVEASLESHRTRVAARAQRVLLVKRLRDAHRDLVPLDSSHRRSIHGIKNALTVIRLNSQAMEESGKFDAEALADIRGSLALAEESTRQLNLKSRTPTPTHRPTWASICELQRMRIENIPVHPHRTVSVADESPNLVGMAAPDCLEDVTNLLVDRALELSVEGAEIALSLRVFPHFARFSVWIPMERSLEEASSPVEPVLLHPARNALVAIGGSVTSSGTESMHRLSAWFPLDDEATYVI